MNDVGMAAELARAGDEIAEQAFRRAGEALGRGLSWLVNLLNLELVVLRCQPAVLGSGVYEPAARESLRANAFSSAARDCEMTFQRRDVELGARSAGSMVFEHQAERLLE